MPAFARHALRRVAEHVPRLHLTQRLSEGVAQPVQASRSKHAAAGDRRDLLEEGGGPIAIRTLQDAGIAACGKHFPGHGDTSTDSHHELPLVEHPPDRLRAVEFEPFRAAIAEQVAFVMTAHVLVPSLDELRPATLSPAVVRQLLREELGFGGVILSDDLEMKAVSARYAVPDAAIAAINAGCDGLLICSGNVDLQASTLEALVHAVEEGRISYKRLEDALARLRRAKERFLGAPVASRRTATLRQVLGCDAHQRIVDEMARYL